MAMIDVSGLTFAYEGSYDNIFEDVSFRIDTDWRLGFCGRNGRGKTTFLNLLMGRHEYRGTISANVAFEYFPREVKNPNSETSEILREIVPDAHSWQIEKELGKLAVKPDVLDREFATLSGGERTKVLLAALFLRENGFPLIDEPTNHLDTAGRETVARYLQSKRGFILVSHDRDFLDGCIDHVLSINKANIEVQAGNFSGWWQNKKMRDDFERAENARLKKDISRLQSAARQSNAWADKVEKSKMGKGAAAARKKGHDTTGSKEYKAEKSRRMQQRRKNLERRQSTAIEEKSALLKNIDNAGRLKIHPLTHHAARLISLDGVAISYGGREIARDVTFALNRGERVAILGGNGTGKSSILKILTPRLKFASQTSITPLKGGIATPKERKELNGVAIIANSTDWNFQSVEPYHSGEIQIATRLKISYVPQDAAFLAGDLSAYAASREIDESLFKAILQKLDFSRVQFEKDMRDFSAGQKKKVLLAASLCESAHVYIWDEPLNYIDILSRIQIEELLAEFKPTMLFVEHDAAFCRNIATATVILS